ncbi:MAG: peroxide stress protein YaaA [Gemmiger sp.]|nr:peroxide stress protein YaaA [Gemmiger sp.]
MRIILSPAKKMNVGVDSLAPGALPQFLPEAECIKLALQALPGKGLQALWGCNDALAALNIARLRAMDLQHNLTPAILAYEGIAYRYMAPSVFEDGHFAYLQEHLRILSGFYGLLRPFDGVTPYRLEMQAKLSVDGHRDLYGFWGGKLANQLASETDFVLNLASKEYSRAVQPYLPAGVRVLTCTFGAVKGGKVVEKGTLCKMARGQMVRWLAEHQVTRRADIRHFDELGYRFASGYSTPTNDVFIKPNTER